MDPVVTTFINRPWPTPLEHARGERSKLTTFQMEVLMSAGTKLEKLGLSLRFVPFAFSHPFEIRRVNKTFKSQNILPYSS